ncbi:MAG: sodium:solute symporter family protein [Planctomycetota bacterium]|nr:sodium:solute symporter family protein [Planctomycetota bacterium]
MPPVWPFLAHGDLATLNLSPGAVQLLGGALIAYVLFLLGISIYASRRVENEADYLVAGRRLPLFLAWGTLIATWFGAATMFAAAGAARDEGLLGVVLDPFACAGTLVLSGIFFARPLWRMELFTMADFYRRRYGPAAEVVGACIQVPAYFSWVALQYTALARILELYFEIPLAAGIVLVAAITLVYTLVGGMWSVTLTDTVQIVIALIGLVVLLIATLSDPRLGDGDPVRGLMTVFDQVAAKHPDHLRLVPSEMSLAVVLGWLGAWATGLFGNIPGQDLQQRAFSAKSADTAMQACILAGVLYLLFGMIPVTLGLASLVTHPNQSIDPVGFLAGEYLSTGMLVVFVVAVVSMVVSTATSAVLAPATILGHNLLARLPALSSRPLVRDRLCVVLVSLGGIALAMWGKSLMELLDVALSIQLVALFVPVLMGIYGRPRGALPAVLSMLMGFGAWLVAFTMEHLDGVISVPLVSALTTIPADFWGLGFAVGGYLLGQAVGRFNGVSQCPRPSA